jgi:AcrR family transcriptional regulator
MVQKPRKPGRPRAYDPDDALERAMATFWKDGYAGTSLDQLAEATAMNRPSLYAAFGDKHALYVETLRRYLSDARAASAELFAAGGPLRETLAGLYGLALDIYTEGGRGCYSVGTAVTEALAHADVRALLYASMRYSDAAFTRLFEAARARGELDRQADPAALGQVAVAVLHTLALRSRAGASRAELEEVVASAIDVMAMKRRPTRRR